MMPEISVNVLSTLILIGAAQGLLLVLALAANRRGNGRANLFLAALIFLLCLGLVDGFLNVTAAYRRFPQLVGLFWPANFLIGPFLFFSVRELSFPRRNDLLRKQMVHFLPAVAYGLFLIPFFSLPADEKVRIWTISVAPVRGLGIFTLESAPFFVMLQKAFYYAASFLLISAYSKQIKERFSSIEKISLSWLRTLLVLFFILCFIFTFYSFCASPFGIHREAGYLFYLSSAVVAYVLAFKALVQPEIFSRIDALHERERSETGEPAVEAAAPFVVVPENRPPSSGKAKYRKSSLSPEEAGSIQQRLVLLMERERLFLDPELTLPQLSEKLALSPHHVSQVINNDLNKSFFDFVNEYRVREAQRLLSSPEARHLSILGVALDAGFNSKSAFYTAFSKHTGMNPTQFKKRRTWSPTGGVSEQA